MRSKKEINIQIGREIRMARERSRLTQEQLAERVDVSPQYVSDLERGVVGVSLPTLKSICVTLGVSSDQILFSKTTDFDFSVLEAKCRTLSKEQFMLLSDIIGNYVDAIQMERDKKGSE
ncbi:MAG: helix-turn-helix domain-containing protein [Firmicutes bacterium]|nr:helix-turn-helix domain-containing protein [Bacillota bacterium]